MGEFVAVLAIVLAILLALAVTLYLQAKGELASAQGERDEIQQKANSALARYKSISDLEKYKENLQTKVNSARAILPKFQKLAEMEEHKARLSTTLDELEQTDAQWRQSVAEHQTTVANLVAQTEAMEETLDMQSFGFYRPKYGFDDSKRYAHELTKTRDAQKSLIKSDEATQCPNEWTVDGSAAKGRKMVQEQAKLMLRAFNGECDAAVSKVKFNNVNNP